MIQLPRVLAWFSCGAASAVAAKLAVDKYGDRVEVVYCNTLASESDDNPRFMRDVSAWLGKPIKILSSDSFASVDEVFEKTKYMAGIKGARCTVEMKKIPRFKFQQPDDIHIFGLTVEEKKRIKDFSDNNFDLTCEWILRDEAVTKDDCYRIIQEAGIELPKLYKQGYRNNNCLGCVKATSPAYWNKVRQDYPEVFKRRAEQSRALGVRLTRIKGERIFLDELPEGNFGRYKLENVSCGPECGIKKTS